MLTNSVIGKRVVVVDDEPMVRQVLATYLDREGFEVTQASNGVEALQVVQDSSPHLVLLDVMLPEMDGLSVLNEIRRNTTVPVILLTARADEADRVLGLEMGADDYVVKPFSPREVAARVRAVLKRSAEPRSYTSRLDFGSLTIDGSIRETINEGQAIPLTPREFDLLFFMASHPRQVFSRGQLLEQVWDSSQDWQDPGTVTVHVRRLRQKLEPNPENPRWLVTVWGVGYRFEP